MFKEKILKTIEEYNLIENGDKIVVGVSGGPDSICLVDILNEIKNDKKIDFEIVICHINHMIREEAKEDQEFVKEYAVSKNIPFYSKEVDVAKLAQDKKISTEEAGRNVRYEFFQEILQKINGNKIATAHTKNDNAETVLMNLLRGSGTSGLKGISPIRDKKYIKPLIEITREEVEEYCRENKLNPRYDKTNQENIYTRNKVRNILIPLIKKEFNPNIIETIDRLSKLITKDNEYNKRRRKRNNIKFEEI